MKVVRVLFRAAALCAVLALLPAAGLAQSAASSGQIVGQVVDSSGGALGEAEVTVRNTDTNLSRQTRTDAAGRFAVLLLPVGAYEITVRAPGLEPAARQVAVTLGGSATADFVLKVAGLAEDVEVTARSVSATGAAKSVLTSLQLQNLPASGRRIRSMFQLTPGTQIEPECGGFSVSGQKGTMININLDGGDVSNTHWCGHVDSGQTVGLEALQEMQVLRSTFSAEFGRSTGGIVNMSTRSGTNLYRGTGYYLYRSDDTTRLDPLGREQIDLSQQFGGSFGGPLSKDRTFFFIAPEFQRNTKPIQTLYAALDTQGVRGTPGAQALLQAAPEADYQALSDSRSFITRVDQRATDRHSLMGRFDYVYNHVANSVGGFNMLQGIGMESVTNRDLRGQLFVNDRNTTTGLLQFTSILSDRFLNEFRFQVFREHRPANEAVSGPEVTVRNAGATVAIYGPQATGLGYGNVGYTFTDTRYQFVNNVSLVTGAHTAKFGMDVNILDGRSTFDPGSNGIYTFNSLADYVARRPFQYRQFAGVGTVDTVTTQVAAYLQDEWRVRPGLTISPGLRYEMAFTPDYHEATVADGRFELATGIPDALDMVAPRLGLSWDPTGSGRTILRAAGGLFYNAPHLPIYEQAIRSNGGNPDLSSEVVITNAAAIAAAFQQFGIDLAGAPLGGLPSFTVDQLNALVAPENRIGNTVYFVDPDFKLARAAHFRVAMEHQLAQGLMAMVDFTNINTSRIARVRNLNLAPPVPDATGRPVFTSERPYGTKYGFVNVTESSARSHYQALTAGLNLSRAWYSADLYYTLGFTKSHDDLERPVNAIAYDDAYNLDNEYSWSNIDQRHQFMANAMVFLPMAFEAAATMRFNTGRPFSANAGSDLNRDGNIRDRAVIDGKVVERNTYRNTNFSEVNLRIQRGFRLPNTARLILSLELFNVFNAPNVEVGSANMVYGPGTIVQNGVPVPKAPPANFGKVKDTDGEYLQNSVLRTSPFQAQIGVRLQF